MIEIGGYDKAKGASAEVQKDTKNGQPLRMAMLGGGDVCRNSYATPL